MQAMEYIYVHLDFCMFYFLVCGFPVSFINMYSFQDTMETYLALHFIALQSSFQKSENILNNYNQFHR